MYWIEHRESGFQAKHQGPPSDLAKPPEKKAAPDIPTEATDLPKASVKSSAPRELRPQAQAPSANPFPSGGSTTNNAPNGFATSGGYLDHPTIYNRDKPPNILGLQKMSPDDPQLHLPVVEKGKEKAVISVKFYTDTSWSDPRFLAVCDRPCIAYMMMPLEGGAVIMPNFKRATTGNPNETVFIPTEPFPPNAYYVFSVIAEDGLPFRLLQLNTLTVK
jgi:hypothetical protein